LTIYGTLWFRNHTLGRMEVWAHLGLGSRSVYSAFSRFSSQAKTSLVQWFSIYFFLLGCKSIDLPRAQTLGLSSLQQNTYHLKLEQHPTSIPKGSRVVGGWKVVITLGTHALTLT
jgi:hypothetical protein